MSHGAVSDLRRVSLVAVGVALAAVDFLGRVVSPQPLFADPLEIIATWGIGIVVVSLGVRAARQHDPDAVWLQARRAGLVALVAVPFGAVGAALLVADGLPAQEAVAVVPFAAATGGLVGAVIGAYERRQRATLGVLESLHTATREMVVTGDPDAVCDRAVEAATDTLGAELVGIWLIDEGRTTLRPVAHNEQSETLLGDLPTYTAEGTSISWSVFESGEERVIPDLRDAADAHNPESPLRSEVVVPLRGFGVMNVGSTTPDAFDEVDLSFIRLLADNAAASLAGARREQALRTRSDQMEFFTSILRHDVRNGIAVIRGRAELLTERLTDDDRQDAETVVKWADEVTEVVDRVSEVLDALTTGTERMRPIDLSAVITTECDRIAATYPAVTIERELPEQAPVLADDLLSEVVGNLLSNAVQHNDPEGLTISTAVTIHEKFVTLRVADNGKGIPSDRRDAVFRRGESTADSGFGLFFVDAMVDAYGGDVRVEESAAGGAAFLLRLPRADKSA